MAQYAGKVPPYRLVPVAEKKLPGNMFLEIR
jgi:hypothetical protein